MDAVYNGISTILFITSPPPKTHSTFSLNKNTAVLCIKINFKIQTNLHFFQAVGAYTFYIWGILLEEQSRRLQDSWCHSLGEWAFTIWAGWVTSYTATPAGKSAKENMSVSLAEAALCWRSDSIIIIRGPILQSLTLVPASSLCDLNNVLGLCKKIKMRNRNKDKKALKRGHICRRRQEYKQGHSGNTPDKYTNKCL